MDKKYELVLDKPYNYRSHVLYPVRAVRDFNGVHAGDIGGYVESEDNLSQDGNCWIYGKSKVYGTSVVTGDATVHNSDIYNSVIADAAHVHDSSVRDSMVLKSALVHERSVVRNHCIITDEARVASGSTVADYASMKDYSLVRRGSSVSNSRLNGDTGVTSSIVVLTELTDSDIRDSTIIGSKIGCSEAYDCMILQTTISNDIWLTSAEVKSDHDYHLIDPITIFEPDDYPDDFSWLWTKSDGLWRDEDGKWSETDMLARVEKYYGSKIKDRVLEYIKSNRLTNN